MSYRVTGQSEGIIAKTTAGIAGFPITTAAWFNADSSNTMAVLSIADSAVNNRLVSIECLAGGTCRSLISGGALETTSSYTTGQWHHLCSVSYSSNFHKIFFDGVEENSTSSARILTSLDQIGIGTRARSSSQGGFDGNIAEVCIWPIGLGSIQVAELFAGRSPDSIQYDQLRFHRDLRLDMSSPNIGPSFMDQLNGGFSGDHPLIWGHRIEEDPYQQWWVPSSTAAVGHDWLSAYTINRHIADLVRR